VVAYERNSLLINWQAANEGDEVMADNDSFQSDIVTDLMSELNLDDAEKTTIANLVAGATGVVTSSVGVLDQSDPIAKLAIKTMVTQQYYDRALGKRAVARSSDDVTPLAGQSASSFGQW
jgi:hypothetical protein